jgi:hypothetical protein
MFRLWHDTCFGHRKEDLMTYLKGVSPTEAGWFTRLVYRFVRRNIARKTGKDRLVEPVTIAAHHPRLLRALGGMERGLEGARSVPASLKRLATLKAALLIGCPSHSHIIDCRKAPAATPGFRTGSMYR